MQDVAHLGELSHRMGPTVELLIRGRTNLDQILDELEKRIYVYAY